MHDYLMEMLACPACHNDLGWNIAVRESSRIVEAVATCSDCGAVYPVREGVGIFLTPDLPRDDLWAQVDSRLATFMRENPDVERQLMKGPLEALNPADQFFRGSLLEERGDYDEAKSVMDFAMTGLYTAEVLAQTEQQFNYVVDQVHGPVVDLASGRGALVERLLKGGISPVVATDFSPSVLRRNRVRFQHWGLYDDLSLVAADARQMPFKDGTVPTLTTYVGLPNIGKADVVLPELWRIVSKMFLAVSTFYDEDDEANTAAIRQFEMEQAVFENQVLAAFETAAWQVEVMNRGVAIAQPTPKSELLGAGIDGLPVTEARTTFCTLVARKAE